MDLNPCSDSTTSTGQTSKTNVLAAVAAPTDDLADIQLQVEGDSANDSVTFAVSGSKIDIDAYYVGNNCYPKSLSVSQPQPFSPLIW